MNVHDTFSHPRKKPGVTNTHKAKQTTKEIGKMEVINSIPSQQTSPETKLKLYP